MFLDHVDSFGKFLKFFVQKLFFLPLFKKGGQNTILATFSKTQILTAPSLYVKSRRKFLHQSLCLQTEKKIDALPGPEYHRIHQIQ